MSNKLYKNKKISILNGPINLIEGDTVTFLISVSNSTLKNDPSVVTVSKIGVLSTIKSYKDNKCRIEFKTKDFTFFGIYDLIRLKGEFLKVE